MSNIDTDYQLKAEHWEREAKRLISENETLKSKLLLAENHEHKRNSPFVPVQNTGTNVHEVDLADIIDLLDEARGFAAMSPGGRDNITFALDHLEDAAETTYRKGFVDGEKHAAEYDSLILDKMLDEATRRMSQPKILGFDAEDFPIDNPEYLPNGDTQIGVEFAVEFLRPKANSFSEIENLRNVLKEYVCECTGICQAEDFGGPCGRAAYAALTKA